MTENTEKDMINDIDFGLTMNIFENMTLTDAQKDVNKICKKILAHLNAERVYLIKNTETGQEYEIFSDGTIKGFGENCIIVNSHDRMIFEAKNENHPNNPNHYFDQGLALLQFDILSHRYLARFKNDLYVIHKSKDFPVLKPAMSGIDCIDFALLQKIGELEKI